MKDLFLLLKKLDQAKTPFTFSLNKNSLKIIEKKKMSRKDILCFVHHLEEKFDGLDFFQLKVMHRECIQKLINHAKRYIVDNKIKNIRFKLLSLCIGANLEAKEYDSFKQFIAANALDDSMLSLGKRLIVDENAEPYFPVFIKDTEHWIPVNKIKFEKSESGLMAIFNKMTLFEMNENFTLTDDYIFTYQGLRKHNIYTSTEIIAFDKQDPKDWQYRQMLEVCTISQNKDRPSMIFNNHAYIVLKDSNGFVRSIGQDILTYFREPKYLEAFSYKRGQGLITTPDTSVFASSFYRRLSKVSFEITKKDHDRILKVVKRDKKNLDRLASLLKGNCASYVSRILRLGAKIEVNCFMSATHIFIKHFLPSRLYKPFKKTHYMPKWLKYMLFYFPPIYISQVLIGISSLIMSKRSLNKRRDFSLFDVFFRPFKIGADHPLKLIRELEKRKGQ